MQYCRVTGSLRLHPVGSPRRGGGVSACIPPPRPGGAAVHSQGREPLEQGSLPAPLPRAPEGRQRRRKPSVPQIPFVVLDPVPSQERGVLLLKGDPPMMLGLPREIASDRSE